MKLMHKEQGSVLFVVLIMLVVITVLAVASLRTVIQDSKLAGNKIINTQIINRAEIALRESEMRLYGGLFTKLLLEKRFPNKCNKENTLNALGKNFPCLVMNINQNLANQLYYNPNKITGNNAEKITWQAADAKHDIPAYFNAYPIQTRPDAIEWGDVLEGKGTYYYLATGKAEDKRDYIIQSIVAVIFLGINN